ncbi:hypothetical protein C2G38_2291413 [Gigaspora rosea]|uniref:CCHC-type domain-containing protein n=1 Tax=Gigaspora rosea TaxID=44941 RepID=A0A397W930_9GLOM|nr:hypothetical protein C2G38_2291413 [Gigaspora rosea]
MTHICTCLGLVNREIIWQHFFQKCYAVIWHVFIFCLDIPSRWYHDKHPDPYEQLYYIAQKFNKSQLLALGVAQTITQKALKKQDHTILEKLQNILEELNTTDEEDKEDKEDEEGEKNEEYEDDNDEILFDLQNPQKKPKRGRSKGTKRIKSSIECRICREYGHNSSTCKKINHQANQIIKY